jgi:phosphopantetheinyl transferase (holo-ACP synthase)
MVGNDVVDLLDPDARDGARHPRFDARVFAPQELAAIAASEAPSRLRWLLWAAKEAAYKAARRERPAIVFSPPRFVVSVHGERRAEVRHDAACFDVAFEPGEGFVHAIATGRTRAHGSYFGAAGSLDALTRDGSSSDAVRALAIASLAPRLGAAPEDLTILRDARRGRVPRLLRFGREIDVPLSLSHHGRFVAFACLLGGASS